MKGEQRTFQVWKVLWTYKESLVVSDRDSENLEMSKLEQMGIADGRAGNNKWGNVKQCSKRKYEREDISGSKGGIWGSEMEWYRMIQGRTNGELGNEFWSRIGIGSKNRTGVRRSELCYTKS